MKTVSGVGRSKKNDDDVLECWFLAAKTNENVKRCGIRFREKLFRVWAQENYHKVFP